ncbi:10737_t:CDS:2 [Diversispora eburnea]|uniref:10737_t:CDS:1 n=1 Tax=Diversispora eburnea TaxID=1213867 RepID=A0A9N8ZBP1_9GLOM|nr:10737_t:CDS:2 [Diversispora eburnea]
MGHCVAITFALLFLLIVLGSYVTVDNQEIPEHDFSKFTGYPTWHPPIDGMNGKGNDEQSATTILFSAVMMIISGYLIMKWTSRSQNNYNKRKMTFFILNDDKTVPTFGFDALLGVYSLVTALTGIMFLWVDVGKIWAPFGALHNAVELVILVNMHYGGRIISNTFLGILSLYIMLNTGLSIFLTWPYDALWFKTQGLCLDWSLVIQFTRTYLNTKKHIKNDAASVFHIFGNIVSTIWIYDASSFTYAISFPVYAYFVYLDTQAITVLPRKVIHLPDTNHWKVAVVTILSLTLAFLTTRLGLPSIEEGYFNSSVVLTEETLCEDKLEDKFCEYSDWGKLGLGGLYGDGGVSGGDDSKTSN